MDSILGLWNKSKVLFFILLPIVVIAFALKIFTQSNVNGARQDIHDTESVDERLKDQQDKYDQEGQQHKENADSLENDINNLDVGENWNK